MTPDDTGAKLASMCCELENWCQAQDLPYESADELLCRGDLNAEERAWLNDFHERWNVVCDGKDTTSEAA